MSYCSNIKTLLDRQILVIVCVTRGMFWDGTKNLDTGSLYAFLYDILFFVACPAMLFSKPYTYIIKTHPAVLSGFTHIFNPNMINLFM